jgi:hypothetical protein
MKVANRQDSEQDSLRRRAITGIVFGCIAFALLLWLNFRTDGTLTSGSVASSLVGGVVVGGLPTALESAMSDFDDRSDDK